MKYNKIWIGLTHQDVLSLNPSAAMILLLTPATLRPSTPSPGNPNCVGTDVKDAHEGPEPAFGGNDRRSRSRRPFACKVKRRFSLPFLINIFFTYLICSKVSQLILRPDLR